MARSYLKEVEFAIPKGYRVARGAMTADSRRLYFAGLHATAPKMFIYEMDGDRQERAEFNIHSLGGDRSFDAVAIDAENLYLVSNSPALGVLADVYPYSKLGTAGRGFSLAGVPDDLDSLFEEVRGAIFLNDEIVVLMQRSTGESRLSIARFKPDGGYVGSSFAVLGIPADVEPRGMVLAGNRIFVLGRDRLLALDRGFAHIPSEDVSVSGVSPVSLGWNGSALLVYGGGAVVRFYGSEQSELAAVPSLRPRQWRSRAFRKYAERVDVVKQNADGSLMLRAVGVEGLRFSTIEEVYVSESADLTTQLRLFTIILLRPLPEIELDDYIFRNGGGMDGAMELPAEKFQVKGFGEWGDRYRQVLYCVRVRGDGEADALTGLHSPLRVRKR